MTDHRSGLDRRRFMKTMAFATGATLASPSILRAQTVSLNFSSWIPASGLIFPNMFVPWAEELAQLTDGRVQIDFFPQPVAPPPAHLGLLRDNKVDMAFSLHSYTQGEFERSKIGQFSFLGDSYSVSNAFSRVYGELLNAEEEHPGMKLQGLFQHGPGVLMLRNKRVDTPEDFRGLKIRTAGGYIGALVTDLGAENVLMSPTDVRQAMIDGAVDGVMFPYEGAHAFNLMDIITNVSELPNGYYNSTFFVGMSLAAAERVGPEIADIVAQHSAQTIHVLAAKAYDYGDYLTKQEMMKSGIEITVTSDDVIAHVKAIADRYENAWAAGLEAGGYDGTRALTFTRRITQGG